MTLKQIDDALAAWNRRLTAMADNLMSLQSESAYRMLTGLPPGATKMPVQGETASRTEKPLLAIRAIFEQFDLLHSVLDRAAKVREGLPSLFGGDEKIAEIQQLLFGRSIELPVASLAFEQRTLLSGAPDSPKISPEELLQAMARTFAEARDAVMAVDRAWQQIAERIVRAETQIAQLEARLAATGCGPAAAAAVAHKAALERIAALTETLRTDPLGTLAHVQAQLEPALGHLRACVEAAEVAHSELARARTDLERLAPIHAEAVQAVAEAKIKIAASLGFPIPVGEEKLRRLGEWLGQLERRWAEGAVETVLSALHHWQDLARACLAEDTHARDASRSALAGRRELRGRLEALKAKARAMGVAEQAVVAAIADEAETLLAARPSDMEKASAAVKAYAAAVNQAPREAV